MDKLRRKGLTALVVFFSFFPAVAENAWLEELSEAEIHFINGRYDASEAVLNRLYSGPPAGSSETVLKNGVAALWKGRIALERADEPGAEVFLLEAAGAAEKLQNDVRPGDSLLAAAYLLEAEARAEIMLFKGVGFIIKNGSRVQELAEKTLDLDPDNPEALVIYAQGRINAPRLFGGNRKEGLEILERLWQRRPGGREGPEMSVQQAYRVAVSLGETLAKPDPVAAARYFRAALALAPDSPRARAGLESLG